jgi:hypothetical protein
MSRDLGLLPIDVIVTIPIKCLDHIHSACACPATCCGCAEYIMVFERALYNPFEGPYRVLYTLGRALQNLM